MTTKYGQLKKQWEEYIRQDNSLTAEEKVSLINRLNKLNYIEASKDRELSALISKYRNYTPTDITSITNTNTNNNSAQTPSYLDKDITSKEYLDSLAESAYKNYAGLMVDPNGPQAQQYKTDMLNAINAEEAQYNATLNDLELVAYRQIGYQQQELENQIAENRLKAIKSGTTSAQLAAQQLNNMFAAQSGAAQIAQQAMNDRLSAAQQYSQMRNTGLTTGLYDTINNNRQALATAGAQNYAVMGSYGSYINSQLANLQANKALYAQLGKDEYNKILGLS